MRRLRQQMSRAHAMGDGTAVAQTGLYRVDASTSMFCKEWREWLLVDHLLREMNAILRPSPATIVKLDVAFDAGRCDTTHAADTLMRECAVCVQRSTSCSDPSPNSLASSVETLE